MNKENAHLFLPLVQALADGKTIQWKSDGGLWEDIDEIEFCMYDDPEEYRIKPEPPRTFEMWYYKPTGQVYPWIKNEKQYVESDEWKRITVQEVLE